MPDRLTEPDELTLRTLGLIDGTTVAEQARSDPRVAKIVRLMLASHRERRNGGANVISLRRDRDG